MPDQISLFVLLCSRLVIVYKREEMKIKFTRETENTIKSFSKIFSFLSARLSESSIFPTYTFLRTILFALKYPLCF